MSEFINIRYISGIPGIAKKMGCTLKIDGIQIKVSRFGKIKGIIKIKDVIQVEAKKETDFTPGQEKDKSVIGRALGGGILLGPLGAVVGGMSGIGTKTKKQAKTTDNWFVIIAYNLDSVHNIAIFHVDQLMFQERNANKIVNEIVTKRQLILAKPKTNERDQKQALTRRATTILTNHLANHQGIETNPPTPIVEPKMLEGNSVKDRLLKLKELYESNLINEDEYSEKKKELLSSL